MIPLFWRMLNFIVMNTKVDLEECQLYLVIPLSRVTPGAGQLHQAADATGLDGVGAGA